MEKKIEPFTTRKTVTITSKEVTKIAVKDSGEWRSRRHFLFAAIASAVGLGNVWRFPSLLKIHGGGAFLLAYCIVTLICGIPMLYLEFSIGELLKKNLIHVWGHVHPLASGVGLSSCLLSIFISSYYVVIVTWLLHYFLYSFQSPLPWIFCPFNKDDLGQESVNTSLTIAQVECRKTTPEAYYWYRESLNISSDIGSNFQWNTYLIIVVAFVWFCAFLNLRKGIQNAEKTITGNVIFPYIALTLLLLRTVFIKGSSTGLEYLFKPKWSRLGDLKLWTDAASQALFSISLGSGCMAVYGSMNRCKKKMNCLADAMIVTLADSSASILGALAVYSILGIRAQERRNECLLNEQHNIVNVSNLSSSLFGLQKNCSISKFLEEAESGTGLAFIDFTYTIAYVPGATLFSALFFLTLFSLGFTSFISFLVSANEILRAAFRQSRRKQMYYFALGCVLMTLTSVFYTQPSGEYFIQLFGSDSQNIPVLVIMLFEAMAVASSKEIRLELRSNLRSRWFAKCMEVIICVLNPILIVGIIVSIIIRQSKSIGKYGAWKSELGILVDKEYPTWATIVGLAFAIVPTLPIFIGFGYGIIVMVRKRQRRTGKHRFNWKNREMFNT